MIEIDVTLCADCGKTFDALQEIADLFGDPLPLRSLVADVCDDCRERVLAAVHDAS